ncbi:MAG: MarR family transcriptional regulator [Polynucleobacter sp.]|nr:MAG: MarR family transcriptional regulator [Polynucleobacter sp.]
MVDQQMARRSFTAKQMNNAEHVLVLLDNGWSVLWAVLSYPDLPQKDLIEIHNTNFARNIAQTTFSKFCNDFERVGLLEKTENGRNVYFSPTDKLLKIFMKIKFDANANSNKQKPV